MAQNNRFSVLFTSVGRRVELLRSFRQAYKRLGVDGYIVAVDIDPLAPALREADRPYIVPPSRSTEYISTLRAICEREQVNLIFPLIDPDILVLAAHRHALEATGARVVVVSSEAATLTADKWLTAQFFRRLGLRTPHSWLPGQIDLDSLTYPVFIKPRKGSASRYTFKVNSASELAFFLEYVPHPIVQEYLPGPEITNDVVCDLEGDVLAVVSRKRIEVRWGEVAKGVTVYHAGITEACVKIAKALPAVGPITVQCIMKDQMPYFTEINARFGGGAPLGIAAGADYPLWLLGWVVGIPVEIPPLGTYQSGLYLIRFDDSLFLTEDEREQMARYRV